MVTVNPMCDRPVVLANFDLLDDHDRDFESPARIIFVLLAVHQTTMESVRVHPQTDRRWRRTRSVRHTAMPRIPAVSHWPSHSPTREATKVPPACRRFPPSGVGTSKVAIAEIWRPDSAVFRLCRRPKPTNDQSMTAQLQSRKPNRRFQLWIDSVETLGGGDQ